MPTTSELRLLDGCQFAHAIFINGIEQVFVDHADLVDYNFGGSRQGVLGLSRDGLTWRHSSNFRKGLLDDNQWSFSITDFDGSLARLFAAVDDSEQPLNDVPFGSPEPIYPNDSLAARTDLHAKHVGTERIGPAGERGLYPAPSGVTFAPKHSIAVEGLDLSAAPVSDNPIVWAGRRVVLYRIYRDHVTYPLTSGQGTWRPFSEAVRLQWGTLRDAGSVRGREWTLDADGPESWLRKPLGVGFQPKSVRAVPDPPTLSTDPEASEVGIGVQLSTFGGAGGVDIFGGRGFVTSITGTTVDEIRDEVIAEINAAAAAATDYTGTASSVWNDTAGHQVFMETDGSVRIAVPDEPANDYGGQLVLVLHRKVWGLLGYDIELQSSLELEADEPRAVEFEEVTNGSFSGYVPGPGYYRGYFCTGRAEWAETGGRDNNGNVRVYEPQHKGGTSVLLADPGPSGQVVRLADAALGLGVTGSSVAHPGQNDRPVASHPDDATAPIEINGQPCDKQGLWLFHGKRRFANSEDTFDEFQVVRASWVGAQISQDGLVSGDTIVVTEILQKPRRFGFDRPPLQSDWVVLESAAEDDDGGLNAMPLINLGWNDASDYDLAHIVAQRLLYGTGTSNGWTSYGSDPEATTDPGDNEPSGDHTVTRDAEIAELGLAIPEDMIHTPEAWAAEAAKVENDEILKVKLAVTPGYQASDALQSLLRPVGWAMHLRGGRYGIWCPADPVTQADAEVVLTRAEKASAWGRLQITPQEIRKWQPVDKWTFNYDYNPKTRKTNKQIEVLAPDAGLRYRPGEVAETINAHGMRGTANGTGERVAHLSRWWSRRHFEVRGWPVHGVDPGEDCWVGTIVRITDATLVDVLGEYGVSGRLGVITGVTHTLGTDQVTCLLDILVFADRAALPRLHAISAQAFGYDSSTRTLYTESNWLRLESDDWQDAPLFSEPSYTGIAQFGGAANVICYQWDGSTWNAGLTGTVASTTSNTIVLANGSTSGTYYRDQDTIVVLRPPTNQDAGEWPLQLYSPICDANGQFVPPGGGTQDGYPWEP